MTSPDDNAREARIAQLTHLLVRAQGKVARAKLWAQLTREIAERSREQVEAMERARGLR